MKNQSTKHSAPRPLGRGRGEGLLLLLLLMFCSMTTAWAEDSQLALTLVSSDANSYDNQGPDKLVYGTAGSAAVWCSKQQDGNGNFVPFNIIVKTEKRTVLAKYDLYEANDIIAYENADWKDWTVYGTNDDPAATDAQWTEVHKVTEAQLYNGQWGRRHSFTIDDNTSAYKYYKVQVTAIMGTTKYNSTQLEYIQMMGHMTFYGQTPNLCEDGNHLFGQLIEAKEPTCTETGVSTTYHQCTECNKYFDLEGNELTEGAWVVPLTEHTFDSDNICTQCGYEKPLLLRFTKTESFGGFDNEGPEKAINGINTDKWCGDFKEGNPYVVMKHEGRVKVNHYYLYTGNDIQNGGNNRNPKEWKLYAKANISDAWTEISHVTDAQLPTEKSTQSNDYTIAEEFQDTYYKYFKFEIVGVEKGRIYEVGELCLMGRPCRHAYADGGVICDICGEIKDHEHTYENNICTQCGDRQQFPLSFNIVRAVPAANVNETAAFAFDGVTDNKWCGEILNGHPYVLLRHDCKARMTRYHLYTGNSILVNGGVLDQNRNPKEWKLYAKANVNDAWTEISHVTNARLTTEHSTCSADYYIDKAYQDTYYRFFKFEIISVDKDNCFEIGELCFFGDMCSHEYAADGVCTYCGEKETHEHNYVHGICATCDENEPANGEGTETSPYLIGNAGQLSWFRDKTRNGENKICGKLTDDIDMSTVCNENIGGWYPIYDYLGTFDGDNHVLTNLYVNDNDIRTGLFRSNGGIIKNLGIESGTVIGNRMVGAISGQNVDYRTNKAGIITNCFNKATVTATVVSGIDAYTGGICGLISGGHTENCYNMGEVSGSQNVGGICGELHSGKITNCYNSGEVTAFRHAGGICGYIWNEGAITNNHNVGTVTCKGTLPTDAPSVNSVIGAINNAINITTNNNYYLQTEGTPADPNATAMTAEQFKSGEVAWLLNGSVDGEGKWTLGKTDGTQAWYQKLSEGGDAYPVLKKTEGNTVFSDCMNTTHEYTNTVGEIHHFGELVPAKEPSCTEAGNIAYHQCTACNKYFDMEGNELAEDALVTPMTEHTYNAEDICTKCGYKKLFLLSFSIVESVGGFDNEGPDKAINGVTTDKWCGYTYYPHPYVVLKNDGKVTLDHYYLYTGNDIKSGDINRNPEEWKLYAKVNADDEWTQISHVQYPQLPTEISTRSDDYTIAEEFQNTYYKYFKFEILEAVLGMTFEVGELCLMGRPCYHQYAEGSLICSICGEEHVHDFDEDGICQDPQCQAPYQKPDGDGTMYSRYRIHNRGNILWLDNNFTDTYLILSADISITEPIIIGSGSTLHLDLNRHALTGEGIEILKVNGGVLNVTDEKSWKGMITKGSHGVMITDGGTFNMYGGNITECSNPNSAGAAVYVQDGCFNIYGGRITKNSGATYGAGVYCVADGETNNTHITLVDLEDPEDPDGKTVIISDNTMIDGDTQEIVPSNLAVSKGALSIGILKDGSMIGVDLCESFHQCLERVNGVFASGAKESDVQFFTPDNSSATITYHNGSLEIATPPCSYDENGICTVCGGYEPANGEGTEASPYMIGNAGQLAWFRDKTQNGRHDICAMLTADIDMAAVCSETVGSWTPIGEFSGVFDGDGYVLTNLYIDSHDSFTALFHQNRGVIKNLGIESGSVTSSSYVVAALCAENYTDNGKTAQIINCFSNADVVSTYNGSNYPNVAGICSSNNGGIIERCYNTGNISGKSRVAGICAVSGNDGIVAHCYNTGKVSALTETAGGIVGFAFNGAKVKSCHNVGEVKETPDPSSHDIVGAKGYGNITVTNCYYLEGSRADERATALTAAQFQSGEATWLLNGSIDSEGKWMCGTTDGSQAWYQKLGEGGDAYPVLLKTEGNTVFSDSQNATKSYTNSGDGGEPTSISNLRDFYAPDVRYNLQGQRVNASHRGIVIQNGRKVVRK